MSKESPGATYPGDDRPYLIEEDGDRAVIRFAAICDHERTHAQEQELLGLVERSAQIACDLSKTVTLSSEWFRWLYRLAVKAERQGKTFALVGVSADLKESADAIALKDKFIYRDRIEEVWEP
jgi:anti-anti-sigma regulatory factor